MALQSIYGAYAEQLQAVIDNSKAMFAPTWYQNYFGFAPIQQSLDYTSIIGRQRIEAAASIVDRDSATPVRSRQGIEKLQGTIPAIKEMFKMTEGDYRNFLSMQALGLDDATKKAQILDFIFGDVKKVGESAHKRLDIMALQAVSTGTISLDINVNPDGLVLGSAIDLLMPSTNKSNASVSWATSASATPITDIQTIVRNAGDRGIMFTKILMSKTLWYKFQLCTQVLNSLKDFYSYKTTSGIAVSTLENVNGYLVANGFPIIELVDSRVGVEKDGVIGVISPFDEDNASFIPAGQLGSIKNAIAIEQVSPISNVSYGQFNRALISKWSTNEPFGEWTKVELNAMPSLEAIDSIFILTAVY